MKKLKREDILYPKLSYIIVGIAFDIYNSLGSGYHEKYYQRALLEEFKNRNITFKREVPYGIIYKGTFIGRNYLDFLIDDKIIVEIKKGNYFSRRHIEQILNYLQITKKKLAILINFGSHGVSFKRIINIKE